MDRDPQDVPLDHAEPVGRPVGRGGGDPRVELRRPPATASASELRERVDLALVERRERLAGEVPLVEQGERLLAGLRGARSSLAERIEPVRRVLEVGRRVHARPEGLALEDLERELPGRRDALDLQLRERPDRAGTGGLDACRPRRCTFAIRES